MPLPSRMRAVVTGAGSGLGRAFCIELARRGARLLLADLDEAGARATVAQLAPGTEAHVARCDVAQPDDVRALAQTADRLWGGADLIVNNAGVATGGLVGDVPLADWQWIVGVNLFGVVHGCHEFVPRFRRQGSGHVINIASAAGLISMPKLAPYNATKAAVVAFSETLAAELHGTGVGVTVLCPTFFPTNIARDARGADEQTRALAQALMNRSTLDAGDVARAALAAAEAGRLFALPHADGRWFWRAKRAAPERFVAFAPRLAALLQRLTR